MLNPKELFLQNVDLIRILNKEKKKEDINELNEFNKKLKEWREYIRKEYSFLIERGFKFTDVYPADERNSGCIKIEYNKPKRIFGLNIKKEKENSFYIVFTKKMNIKDYEKNFYVINSSRWNPNIEAGNPNNYSICGIEEVMKIFASWYEEEI